MEVGAAGLTLFSSWKISSNTNNSKTGEKIFENYTRNTKTRNIKMLNYQTPFQKVVTSHQSTLFLSCFVFLNVTQFSVNFTKNNWISIHYSEDILVACLPQKSPKCLL